MPNIIAQLVFYAWPLVVLVIFRKMPLGPAIVWSFVLGYLLLPNRVGIDLPAIPTIGKHELTAISVAVMCWLTLRREKLAAQWKAAASGNLQVAASETKSVRRSRARGLSILLLMIVVVSPLLTVLNNGDPMPAGPRWLPGLRLYDAFSMIGASIFLVIPYWLGQRFLNTPESHVAILRVFCFALLGYSLLALFEVRMSPQLNKTLYGFYSHSFAQHVRAGGFRPMVFMGHGLELGILLAMSVLATTALWRHEKEGAAKATVWVICVLWLLMTLVLAKSVGALLIALAMVPFVIVMGARGQLLFASVLAGVVILYPMLRGAGYIPTEQIHEITLGYSEQRAQSLKFRLDNEDLLLAKANERPLLGWGSWGRNMLHNSITGRESTVADGIWIIIIGRNGWIGYVAQFGLLTIPIFLLAMKRRRLDISIATAGVAIILTANLVDMIPNSALRPITWLLAGALLGRYITATEAIEVPQTQASEIQEPAVPTQVAASGIKVRRPRGVRLTEPVIAGADPPSDTNGSRHQRKRRH